MSKDELVDLFISNQKKDEELNWYREQFEILKKQRFASKSEKAICGQLNLFNEVEDIYDHSVEEDQTSEETEGKSKNKKRRKTREANFSKLPTRIIEHKLEDIHCEICGSEMKELAPEVIDVLKYQPARYTVERHIVHQYICPQCTDENLEAEIVAAPGAPKRLIKGSVTSPSVVAGIVFDKYVSGIPLYRREQELKRRKVEISRATMSNWLMKSANLLKPLYELMLEDARKLSHVHMDETTIVVLEDKKIDNRSKSYMWMLVSGKHEKKQLVIYWYSMSREYDVAKQILGKDFTGGVHSDGYEAYHDLGNVTVFGCMAHARRYIVEAIEVSDLHKRCKKMSIQEQKELCEKNPGYGDLVYILNIIDYLFGCEKEYIAKGLTPSEIKKHRQEEQKPKLDELFTCLEKYQQEHSAKTKAAKAVNYALNQRKYLETYLSDGEAEISNNRGERLIKPFVMGRKAWLFSKTKSGANMSGLYYSLTESAKMNNLDVHNYLEYILTRIQEDPDGIDYRTLLPYAEELPDSLRIK